MQVLAGLIGDLFALDTRGMDAPSNAADAVFTQRADFLSAAAALDRAARDVLGLLGRANPPPDAVSLAALDAACLGCHQQFLRRQLP